MAKMLASILFIGVKARLIRFSHVSSSSGSPMPDADNFSSSTVSSANCDVFSNNSLIDMKLYYN